MNLSTSVFLSSSVGLSLLVAVGADLSPKLEVLPLNSTLSNVTIPRYDENQNCVAYLKADLMEILADGEPVGKEQPIMVDCSGIQLRMATEQTNGDITVNMKKALYRLAPGVLTVQEKITASSSQFSLTGTGGIFHLDSQRGFIFGPLNCGISSQPLAQNSTMFTPLNALLATTTLALANPGYQPLSAEELLKVEQLSKSSQMKIEGQQDQLLESARKSTIESKHADNKLLAFADTVDSKPLNLLIQNPPAPAPANGAKAPPQNPDFSISCDGGCFFDGEENLLVLLRDIVVKEARFTLKAKKEIKVLFNVIPEDEKKAKEGEKAKKGTKLNISDVKSLIATGGIHFSGIDKKGNPVEASSETAFYDDKEKLLILKGGKPTFWTRIATAKGQTELHFQAENPDSHVKIELIGDTMTATTSPNGWQLVGDNPYNNN